MAATCYVNPDSATGGDGTTNATSGANRAYHSLSEGESDWFNNADGVLTGEGVTTVYCEVTDTTTPGTYPADDQACTIDGWTTGASDYIDIQCVSPYRHPGYWSTSKYRLDTADAFVSALDIREAYVRVTGLQVRSTDTWSGSHGIQANPGTLTSSIRIADCLARTSGGTGIYCLAGTFQVRNCAAYGCGSAGIGAVYGTVASVADVLNCVSCGNTGEGFYSSSASNTAVLRNCYAGGNTGADISTNWGTIQTSYTEDGSESTPTAAYSTSSGCYFTNITAGSQDFHIGASSTLRNQGTDLSGTFTTDIDGQTRPTGAGTWDVGADEYISAASPSAKPSTRIALMGVGW